MNATTETGASGSAKLVVRDRAKEVPTEAGIGLSEKAAAQIKQILEKDNYPDTMYLFVAVKGGGCSGFQYVLDLRDEALAPVAETDEIFLSHGIPIVCDLKSFVAGNLGGTTIDYQDGLMGAGFTFSNPNAKHTCGCGSSYSP
ncbi:MAG: iron-sulfur cluster assembly accessory protein [Planctomycetes bacterium]|nr:iron-sulfur cluster assembly accessory protein [Planctomycetota bacterium]